MAVVQNYLPGDPLLIDKIVYELKSQGIFDQFRKECIADVDTKPAYQNLRQRVEGSVSGFLSKQKWSPDMNKNQLREMLRKNIYESGFLETGVERIVDQVVNPKINSIFLPKVTEVVYKFLGIEKASADKREPQKSTTFNNDNLLPTDLEAVSPESEKKFDISNDSQNLDDSKIDEDESPPFEPLEEKPAYIPAEENSVDSHLSGFSGLMSHDSNHSQEFSKPILMEVSNQDSLLSKQSSEGHLSIVMSDDNDTKMEICEDSLQHKSKVNDTKTKTFDLVREISNKESSKGSEEKVKINKSSKPHDKHRSRHDSRSDRKDKKDRKSDKDHKSHKDKHSSKDKGREKDRTSSKTESSKSDKSDKDSKSNSKSDKDRHKTSSSSSNRHSSSSKDKDKSSSSKKEHKSSSKDRGDNKDKSKSSSSKDKDSKHKDEKSKSDSKSSSSLKHESRSDKHKKDDKHKSSKHSSSSKSRDKDKKESKKDKKDTKDDHFSSKKKSNRRSTDRDSNDGQSGLKSSSSSFDSYVSSQTQSKSQESSNSNSNTGSGDSGNSDAVEHMSWENMRNVTAVKQLHNSETATSSNIHNLSQLRIPTLKLIKPKFASNIHEARRLMKIRKQLTLLEKQSMIDFTHVINSKAIENNKFVSVHNIVEDRTNGADKEDLQKLKNKKPLKVNNIVDQNVNQTNLKINNKLDHKVNNNKIKNFNKNDHLLKCNCIIVTATSDETIIETVTSEQLSPPLKSATVSAASWDALEAKLHQSLNYSTSYEIIDTTETAEVSISYNKDDCLYLEPNSIDSRPQKYLKFSSKYIKKLEDTIQKYSTRKIVKKIPSTINSDTAKKSTKRKYPNYHQSDLKNNNKKFNTHHIEVHENFTLPLSPAESENSIDKKSDTSESSIKTAKKTTTEFMQRAKKTVRAPANTQRYSSEDLYKPRPFFRGTRRRTGRNMGID